MTISHYYRLVFIVQVKKTVSKSKSYIPTVIEEPNAVEEKNNKSNLSVIENKSRSNDHQTDGSLTITKHQLQHTALPSNDDVKVFQTNEEEIVSVLSSTSNTLMEQEQYRQHAKKKKSAYKGFDKILDTQAKVDVEVCMIVLQNPVYPRRFYQ